MKKSGLADSPLFTIVSKKQRVNPPRRKDPPTATTQRKKTDRRDGPESKNQPSNHDTITPRNHDTTVSRYHDTITELIRKAVKEFGKEAATHRFTSDEKKAIADIVYSYKNRGIRTSENEIARIAVNFLINDYKINGENSVLDRALKALNG